MSWRWPAAALSDVPPATDSTHPPRSGRPPRAGRRSSRYAGRSPPRDDPRPVREVRSQLMEKPIVPGARPVLSTASVPPLATYVSVSVGSPSTMPTTLARPASSTAPAAPATRDGVVTRRADDGDLVDRHRRRRSRRWSAPRSTSHGRQHRAGQVVDGELIGAAEGVEVDRLDAGRVHEDVAQVAGERHVARRARRRRTPRRRRSR